MTEHILVVCHCGTVVIQCRCPGPHVTRLVEACGACTATGAYGVELDPLPTPGVAFQQRYLTEEEIISPLLSGPPEEASDG